MSNCPICQKIKEDEDPVFENESCVFIPFGHSPTKGLGIITTKNHREQLFELSATEMAATFGLLKEVQEAMTSKYRPAGFNIGWNLGKSAGQAVEHIHMLVIPRYEGECHEGRGIDYWFTQEDNHRGMSGPEREEHETLCDDLLGLFT